MRRYFVAAALTSALTIAYPSAQADHAGHAGKTDTVSAGAPALTKTILELEKKRVAAMVSKDVATLDALLADDMSYTHSAGRTDTKASFITLIKERGNYLGVDYSDTQVIPWGGNSVLVRGKAQIRLQGTAPYYVLFVDVWAQRGGSWKMVAWQATRVPEDK